MAKENKSDKFVVYVQRASTSFPIVRVWKCSPKGNLGKGAIQLTPRAIWKIGNYKGTAQEIGQMILKHSNNVKEYKRRKK